VGMLLRCYATAVETTRRFVRRQYNVCVTPFSQLPGGVASRSLPFDQFIQAVNAVQSRSFLINKTHHRLEPQNPHIAQIGTNGKRCALIPLNDLLNHRVGARMKIDRSDRTWRLISIKSSKKGEQMFGCALSPPERPPAGSASLPQPSSRNTDTSPPTSNTTSSAYLSPVQRKSTPQAKRLPDSSASASYSLQFVQLMPLCKIISNQTRLFCTYR